MQDSNMVRVNVPPPHQGVTQDLCLASCGPPSSSGSEPGKCPSRPKHELHPSFGAQSTPLPLPLGPPPSFRPHAANGAAGASASQNADLFSAGGATAASTQHLVIQQGAVAAINAVAVGAGGTQPCKSALGKLMNAFRGGSSTKAAAAVETGPIRTESRIARQTKPGRKPKIVPFPLIASRFGVPIEDASRELGVCVTVIKRTCRQHGLMRWPFRRIQSQLRPLAEYEHRVSHGLALPEEASELRRKMAAPDGVAIIELADNDPVAEADRDALTELSAPGDAEPMDTDAGEGAARLGTKVVLRIQLPSRVGEPTSIYVVSTDSHGAEDCIPLHTLSVQPQAHPALSLHPVPHAHPQQHAYAAQAQPVVLPPGHVHYPGQVGAVHPPPQAPLGYYMPTGPHGPSSVYMHPPGAPMPPLGMNPLQGHQYTAPPPWGHPHLHGEAPPPSQHPPHMNRWP